MRVVDAETMLPPARRQLRLDGLRALGGIDADCSDVAVAGARLYLLHGPHRLRSIDLRALALSSPESDRESLVSYLRIVGAELPHRADTIEVSDDGSALLVMARATQQCTLVHLPRHWPTGAPATARAVALPAGVLHACMLPYAPHLVLSVHADRSVRVCDCSTDAAGVIVSETVLPAQVARVDTVAMTGGSWRFCALLSGLTVDGAACTVVATPLLPRGLSLTRGDLNNICRLLEAHSSSSADVLRRCLKPVGDSIRVDAMLAPSLSLHLLPSLRQREDGRGKCRVAATVLLSGETSLLLRLWSDGALDIVLLLGQPSLDMSVPLKTVLLSRTHLPAIGGASAERLPTLRARCDSFFLCSVTAQSHLYRLHAPWLSRLLEGDASVTQALLSHVRDTSSAPPVEWRDLSVRHRVLSGAVLDDTVVGTGAVALTRQGLAFCPLTAADEALDLLMQRQRVRGQDECWYGRAGVSFFVDEAAPLLRQLEATRGARRLVSPQGLHAKPPILRHDEASLQWLLAVRRRMQKTSGDLKRLAQLCERRVLLQRQIARQQKRALADLNDVVAQLRQQKQVLVEAAEERHASLSDHVAFFDELLLQSGALGRPLSAAERALAQHVAQAVYDTNKTRRLVNDVCERARSETAMARSMQSLEHLSLRHTVSANRIGIGAGTLLLASDGDANVQTDADGWHTAANTPQEQRVRQLLLQMRPVLHNHTVMLRRLRERVQALKEKTKPLSAHAKAKHYESA